MKVFNGWLFLMILSFCGPVAFAQQAGRALFKQYEYGKSFLNNNQYRQAQEVFKQLAAEENDNPYQRHAMYFHALSAYKAQGFTEARTALFNLIRKFPNWDQLDDAYYLLAATEMELKSPTAAFEFTNKIKSPAIKQEANQMLAVKALALSTDDLVALYQKNPNDVLGKALYQRLSAQPSMRHADVYQVLAKQFGSPATFVNGQIVQPLPPDKPQPKSSYQVALMLPFTSGGNAPNDQNDPGMARIYDLYNGILLAVERLQKEGMNIQVRAFDSSRDSVKTREILADPFFRQVDLFIGPLFPTTIPVVNQFVGMYGKVMVNPVSSNQQVINRNPYVFLSASTPSTQARRVADYAIDSLKSRKVYIVHGGNESEDEMAAAYQVYFEQRGGKVVYRKPFDYSPKGFNNLLNDLRPLATDTTSHVFVCSSDPVVAVNLTSALQNIKSKAPVFAPQPWLTINQLDFQQMESLPLYVYHPQFVDDADNYIREFTRDFVRKMSIIPSPYAFTGYDTMYFFGQLLRKYGTSLPTSIHTHGFQRGELFPGFSYLGGNDNQFVPILRFHKGDLQVVNLPPSKQ